MSKASKRLLSLKGITIFAEEYFSRERKIIPDNKYSRADLLKFLSDAWIPYFECHECGRFSYCKFSQPYPSNPNIAADIQCGVVITALDNFLLTAWERLLTYNQIQLQHFVDGLFFYVKFVYDVELTIGSHIDIRQVDYWGENFAPRLFGRIAHFRVYLDRFSYEFRDLKDYGTRGKWIVVEGEAEKAFLERLFQLRFYANYVGGVESYDGKGNVKPSKFKLYAQNLENRGYSIVLQGDEDGSGKSPIENIVQNGIVKKELTFPFTKDFEGAFPPEVLCHALQIAGYDISEDWFKEKMLQSSSGPIIRIVEAKLNEEIEKVRLAKILAEIIAENWGSLMRKYPESEIFRWLNLLHWE